MAQIDTTKPKRRTYSKELKAYLVEQALTGKRSIANLAQGHGINPNLLQKWIKSVRDEKIAATLSQPLASSNIETNLIDHGSEPAFLPVILQHKTKHEITPQATALAQTITGVELQIPKHNGTPITLSIDVGGNATFNAGQLINQGGTSRLVAQGDVALNAVNTGFQTNAIGDSNNYYKVGQTQDIGSVVASQGSTYIQSKGGSITGTAVTIHSEDGSSYLDANKDITLKEGRATSNTDTASKTTEKSLLSRKTTQDRNSATSDEAIQSNIEGNTVVMDAGHDIHLTATRAVSDSGTALTAGNDVTIDAAQNRYSESSSHSQKKSGIFGTDGGIGFTIGSQKQSMDNQRNIINHTGSTVGAIDGNVVINAGNHYQQTASDVVAGMGADTGKGIIDPSRGNIDITAKSADIVNATATEDSQSQQKFKQTGLTVSVSNGLVDQYNSINGLVKAGENADSDRMKAMAGISAGLKAQNAIKGVAQAQDPVATATSGRIQATLGTQSSQSTNQSHTQTNEASTVNAAGNLSIKATGAGKDSNINIVGSQLKAGNNGSLSADNEVNILASSQQNTQTSQNKAQGFGVGVYAAGSASGKTGAGITLNANASRGSGDGESTHYTNSQIDVGNTFSLSSGSDTNIRGGVINAKRAEGSVGGNLNIESMQNKETYQGKQRSVGINADIDMVGSNSTNLSVNGGKTNVNSDYVGVNQQSGIFTGDGGFNINVEGKTTLTGGAITTTDKAKQQGLNQFTSKGGIESLDLENHARYEGNAIQAGYSLNGSKATQDPQKVDPNLKTSWNGKTTGIGYGKAGDNQSSVTKAGITGIAGQAEITTDNKADYAGVIKNNFDNNKIMKELGSQTQITQAFGQEAPKAVGDYASNKQLELINAGNLDEAKKWGEGGIYRVALHTLSSALATGSIEGAIAGGGTAIAVPKVDEYLKQQGYDEETRKAVLVGLSAGIGGTVGNSAAGLASSVNQTENNYLSHIQMQKWAEQLKACKGESVCINGINQYYQSLNKEQDKRLNSVCINNFNNAQCKAEIANFYAGLPKGSAPFQNDYNQISAFGGGILRNNVTASNDMAFSDIIRKGLANISRAENRPGDAIAADLMNAELWGGGAGRLGTVTKAKPVIQQKPVQTNNKIDANSDSNKAIIQAESLAQKKISQNQKNTTNLSRKPNSTVLNQKLATDLKAGKLPGKAEKSGIPREMPKTATPSQTADDFARRYLGRKPNTEDFERGSEMNGGDCSGCWRSQTSDGAWVVYRPAGKAGKDTLPTTATVEINNSSAIQSINSGKNLKLKFPKE